MNERTIKEKSKPLAIREKKKKFLFEGKSVEFTGGILN